MRLGQLARKYNISQDDVILYLNEIQPELSPFHHNSKLSDETEDLVTSHFSSSSEETVEITEEEPSEDVATEINEPNLDLIEIDRDKEIEASLQQELDPTLPPIQTREPEKKEKQDEKAIETDRLLELLESDKESIELSKITHIKASKKELSGLKVVGKIELAEPKSKPTEKNESQDKELIPEKNNRHERQRISDGEKEKRRLKAKEKKEQFEVRQEKRRKEAEKKERKAMNKARYEQKMQRTKANQSKPKPIIQDVASEVNELPPKPTTILGKFWNWLKA